MKLDIDVEYNKKILSFLTVLYFHTTLINRITNPIICNNKYLDLTTETWSKLLLNSNGRESKKSEFEINIILPEV
jgi:hypothetical protein